MHEQKINYIVLFVASIFLLITLILLSIVIGQIHLKYNKKYNKDLQNYILSSIITAFVSLILIFYILMYNTNYRYKYYNAFFLFYIIPIMTLLIGYSDIKQNLDNNIQKKILKDNYGSQIDMIMNIYSLTVYTILLFLYCLILLVIKKGWYNVKCIVYNTYLLDAFNSKNNC